MRKNPLPSQEYLRSILDYDLFTGVLTWKHRPDVAPCVNARFAGREAGCAFQQRHRVIRIDGLLFQEHRVIWKWVYGTDPDEIDHRFGNRADNRIWLLREATRRENARNVRARGEWPRGVCYDKSRGLFAAKYKLNGKTHNLGRFSTPEEAHAAYVKATAPIWGEFACYDR